MVQQDLLNEFYCVWYEEASRRLLHYLSQIRKQNLTRATSENIPHAAGLHMLTVFFKNL